MRAAAPGAVALVLVGVNLRLGIASVPAVVDQARDGLGLSSAAVGAVTTLPVLCFGLAAFGAPALARRFSDELVILACLVTIMVGIALRLVPTIPAFFAGTLLLGVGVAIANVVVTSVIKRRFTRPAVMTALTVTATMGGAGVAIALTVPLSLAFGGWDRALAVWALPAVIAALAWLPMVRTRERQPTARAAALRPDAMARRLCGMFACQTLLGFALLAWTPNILHDNGLGHGAAGLMAAVVMLLGIPTAIVVPVLAARERNLRALVIATAIPWWAGLAGLLLAPGAGTAIWMVLLGLGQGAGFALPLTLIVLQARDAEHAASLSSLVQGVGYVVGGLLGPLAIGALHDLTRDWDAPLLLLVAVAVAQLAFGLGAIRRGDTLAGMRALAPSALRQRG